MKIKLKEINMPEDVIINSGYEISLNGKLTGDSDEIIVITQLRREVFDGYVCHISHGYTKRNGGNPIDMILDMPGFKKIIIYGPELRVHEFGGIKYTMACLAEKEMDVAFANWL